MRIAQTIGILAGLTLAGAVLAGAVLAGPTAQPELPQDQVQAGLASALQKPGQILDFVRGWHVDWNGDGAPEVLAQASYAQPGGGNAVVTEYYIMALNGGTITRAAQLDLPGFVQEVFDQPGLIAFTLVTYGENDARCCPSVQLAHWAPKP